MIEVALTLGMTRHATILAGIRQVFPSAAFQFLREDGYAEIAGLDAVDDAELQHLHDLVHRRACSIEIARLLSDA